MSLGNSMLNFDWKSSIAELVAGGLASTPLMVIALMFFFA